MTDFHGKVLYGTVFCLILPAMLVLWAMNVNILLPLPAVEFGWASLIAGFGLVIVAMRNLWTFGGGLPMNAYPPKHYVTRGAYGLIRHPIYVGFCMTVAGGSIAVGSASGFYLIAPVLVLSCWALVIGYENPDLERRFGSRKIDLGPLSPVEKGKRLLPLFSIWLIGYQLLVWVGFDQTYISTMTVFDRRLPIIEWTELLYSSVYLLALVAPFSIPQRSDFDDYMNTAWWIVVAGLFLQFLFPFYFPPRDFTPHTWLGEMILWERALDGAGAAFPSFHVLWAFLSAYALSKNSKSHVWWIIAWLIAISCITSGAHSLSDVAAGIFVFYVILKRTIIINFLQRRSEKIANSWSEWCAGPIRIINHSMFSALAGFVGAFIVAQFSSRYLEADAIILSACVGAMLWGQFMEGSPAMLRPFGYFGAIVGGIACIIFLYLVEGVSIIYWLAVFGIASPFTQSVGRLRCLVQGCCHGRVCSDDGDGIRYSNQHTRVALIPELTGKTIHNTQGYSIVGNIIAGLVILRLYYGGASNGILAGSYFILSGVLRFVEESYRGEPQTRYILGLRLYQWLAVASVILGCALTTLSGGESVKFEFNFSWTAIATSLFAGLIWGFGMSIDFPGSKWRFSRLTG